MQSYRYFTVDEFEDVVVARAVDTQLQGLAQAEFIKQELLKIIQLSTPHTLVIDFHNVKMISSSVIGSFLVVKSQAAIAGTRLKLTMTDSLRNVFRTLNMDGTVFDIFVSTGQALASASRSDSYYDVCGQISPPDEDYDVTVSG